MENPLLSIVLPEERNIECEPIVIKATDGTEFMVPSNVAEKVRNYTWYHHYRKEGSQHSLRTKVHKDGIIYSCSIYQFLLGRTPAGYTCIDHIDRNRLNNHWTNLRFATNSTNMRNVVRNHQRGKKSNYRGVTYHKGKWITYVNRKHVASFDHEEHAAWMYNLVAVKHEGYILNDIVEPEGFVIPSPRYDTKGLPRGVHITKFGKYRVRINKKNIGSYETREEAIEACKKERKRLEDLRNEKICKLPIERNKDGVAIIPLNSSKNVCLVDDDDYYDLKRFSWCSDGSYAVATIDGKLTRMHKYVMKNVVIVSDIVDHINRNKYDNRKTNLRRTDVSGNGQNRPNRNILGFTGVYKRRGNFSAKIIYKGKEYCLGSFPRVAIAAYAYNVAALKFHGPGAYTNNVEVPRGYEWDEKIFKLVKK